MAELSPGQKIIKSLLDSGNSEEEVARIRDNQTRFMLKTGMSKTQVDEFFGVNKTPDLKNFKNRFNENIDKNFVGPPQPVTGPPEPAAGLPKPPTDEELTVNHANTTIDRIKAGLDMSVLGLAVGPPDMMLPENADMFDRIVSGLTTFVADWPIMVQAYQTGAVVGAAIPGTARIKGAGSVMMGSAFALMAPVLLRETIIDGYDNGDFKSFKDGWSRMSSVAIEGGKAGIVGFATGGAARFGAFGRSTLSRESTRLMSEVATFTTVGAGLEGEFPEPEHFLEGALFVLGLRGVAKTSRILGRAKESTVAVKKKLQEIYKQTGEKPAEVAFQALQDPFLRAELLSKDPTIPARYLLRVDPKATKDPELSTVKHKTAQGELGEVSKITEAEKTASVTFKHPEPKGEKVVKPPVKDAIGIHIVSDRPVKKPMTLDEFMTGKMDRFHPLKAAEDGVLKGKDVKFDFETSPYVAVRINEGSFGIGDLAINFKPVDFKNKQIVPGVKGLLEIIDPVRKELDKMDNYMASARIARDLAKRGIKTPISEKDAIQFLKDNPHLEKPFQETVKLNDYVLQYAVDGEWISPEMAKKWRDVSQSYTPLHRLQVETPSAIKTKGGGLLGSFRKMVGSEKKIISPLETMVRNIYAITRAVEKNRVVRNFVDWHEQFPEQTIFKKVPKKVIPIKLADKEAIKFGKEHGIPPELLEELIIFRPQKTFLKDNQFILRKEGKTVIYETSPEIAKALREMDPQALPLWAAMARPFSATLRAGATALNPEFMLKNPLRDTFFATVTSTHNFIPIHTTLMGLSSVTKSRISTTRFGKRFGIKPDPDFLQWLANGGANGEFQAIDRDYIARDVFRVAKNTGYMSSFANVIKTPIDHVRMVSTVMEQATRVGDFKLGLKEVRAGKKGIKEITFESRESALDFAKFGGQMAGVNSSFAFFNPKIRGLDRTYRAFREQPVKTITVGAGLITTTSVLLWWANKDDPRMQEIDRAQKDLFWIVPVDDWQDATNEEARKVPSFYRRQVGELDQKRWQVNKGAIFRIPKPFEMGILFGSLPERVLEKYFKENPKALKDFEDTMIAMFAPPFIPDVIKPFLETYANRSTFTGNPIIPGHLEEKTLSFDQYTPYTSEFAKAFSKLLGQHMPGAKFSRFGSPIIFEQFVKDWSGGVGMYALQMIDASLAAVGVLPTKLKPEATLAELPFIKAFALRFPTANSQSVKDFYENNRKVEKITGSFRLTLKRFQLEEARTRLQDPEVLSALAEVRSMRRTHQSLSTLSALIQRIHDHPKMTPSDKLKQVTILQLSRIRVAQVGNKISRSIKEKFDKIEKEREK